jgi:glycosyltransferase involved in cell wall biosynthesis
VINLVGAFTDPSGYGEAARNYAHCLDSIGPVALTSKSFWHGGGVNVSQFTYKFKGRISEQFNLNSDTRIFNLTPENFIPTPHVRNIGMTTFETDSIPASWFRFMQSMDEIITFSKFNQETFSRAGITRPIHIVPHGVDVDRFKPRKKKPIHARLKDKFVFGVNAEWSERKNLDNAIAAYLTAFQGNKDVAFLIKTFSQDRINIAERIARIRDGVVKCGKFPQIYLIEEMLSPKDMINFYNSIDCLFAPSRGEGFNLTCSEAMACGKPVIATGWGGNTSYMNNENSILLDYKIVPVPERFSRGRPLYTGQNWADPNPDTMIEALRVVAGGGVGDMGKKARQDMVDNWTWTKATEELKRIL